ncbi:MAG: hypothetical protein ACE5IJ_11035 [Thermoplasmata archaeon]
MVKVWVVRLGEGGELAEECRDKGIIAIGWTRVGDFKRFLDYEALRKGVYDVYTDRYRTPGSAGVTAGML